MVRGTGLLLSLALLLSACSKQPNTDEMAKAITVGLNEQLAKKGLPARVQKVMLVREDSRNLTGIATLDSADALKVTVKTDGSNFIWEVSADQMQALALQTVANSLLAPETVSSSSSAPPNPPSPQATAGDLDQTALQASVRRTMADILSIATAVEVYAVDNNRFPDCASIDCLAHQLEPLYSKTLPRTDQFGSQFRVEVSKDGSAYRLTSAGADRQFEALPPLRPVPPGADAASYEGPTGPFDDSGGDLVFSNGEFRRWWRPVAPKGQ